MRATISLVFLMLSATLVVSQPFIPAANNVSANWQKAGLAVIGGIPPRNTQCGATVTPSGITPPATGDDASKINAAIAACAAGQVVLLGAGTFQLDVSENIVIDKSITLRGTGTCNVTSLGANPETTGGPFCPTMVQYRNGTWPVQNGPSCGSTTGTPPNGTAPATLGSCPNEFCALICMQPSSAALTNFGWGGCLLNGGDPTQSNCGTLLAVDAAQGTTTVQVASTANFSVGMWVMIDERPQWVTAANPTGHGNASVKASSDWLSTSPSPATARLARPDGGCDSNYGLCSNAAGTDRFNHEIHLVSAIGAGPCPGTNCTLTFDSPLTLAFRQSNDPSTGATFDARVYWPQASGVNTPFLQQAGVENLTVSRAVNGPISMMFCAYCWIKNVEAAYWVHGIDISFSVRSQLTGSYIHDCADCANDGAEYPIGINAADTEILVDNNIVLFGGKGMVGRAASASVVAYNYVDWQRYQPGVAPDGFIDMGLNGSHEIGTHHFLFEGNRSSNCDNDNTHGNNFYHVYFRNHCAGLRTNAAAGGPGPLRAFGPMSFNYWLAYVANVGGLAGVSTTANGWVYFRCANGVCGNGSETIPGNTIYMAGWSNPDWKYADANLDGTNGAPFFFRNGNFDYVTNGIPSTENPTPGYSGAFPNSMYLSSPPSYFNGTSCTYPWPWVTPTSSPYIQTNRCGGSGLPALARWNAGTPFVQPESVTATHDFNGDGKSDIPWRDSSGNVSIWEMNGTQILNPTATFVANVSYPQWTIIGTGDFNGDGYADILWRDTSNDLAIWLMNGTQNLNPTSTFVATVPGWSVVGTGDFNGDGSTDILWTDGKGNYAIWEMNGTQVLNPTATYVAFVSTNWSVIGTGDFNGDGKSDILWKDGNGDYAIWEMNGTQILNPSATFVATVPAPWSVIRVGDFNGNGTSDLLWTDGNGNYAIWEMSGTQVLNPTATFVAFVSINWSVVGTGDYNGDGKSDILWTNGSSSYAIWEMNGTTVLNPSATFVANAPTNSSVQLPLGE
jgi:FG-GAP-like repeat/FG-GAP repeat